MKSGYLEREQAKRQVYLDAAEAVMKQFMVDTLQCTLRDEGWGYDRVKALTEKWGAKYSAYYPALNAKNVEADYLRECLDLELRHMIRDRRDIQN